MFKVAKKKALFLPIILMLELAERSALEDGGIGSPSLK